MNTISINISSTPEQIFIQKGNESAIILWKKLKEIIPDIFSIEDVYTVYYEPSMGHRTVIWSQNALDKWHAEGVLVDPDAPIKWLDANLEYLLEKCSLFFAPEEYGEHVHTASTERHFILHETDWLVSRHLEQTSLNLTTTLTEEQYTLLLTYRQALRSLGDAQDLSLSYEEIQWPQKPEWITNLPGSHLYEPNVN